MRLYAIGDIHLPGGPQDKPMDRFGEVWHDHSDQVVRAWREQYREGDVLLLVGDLSWAMTLDEARDDLAWIEALPGRKVILKGNHDFWWSGINKVRSHIGESVTALQYDHVLLGDVAVVGTRGWQCPGEIGSADLMAADGAPAAYSEKDEKIYRREVGRLKLALERLQRSGTRYETLVVALHYPPMNPSHEPSGFTELIDAHGADLCVHGHLHGEESIRTAFEGRRGKTLYHCVSADAVRMRPRLLLDGADALAPSPRPE